MTPATNFSTAMLSPSTAEMIRAAIPSLREAWQLSDAKRWKASLPEVFGASARQSLADLTAEASRQSWSELFAESARQSLADVMREAYPKQSLADVMREAYPKQSLADVMREAYPKQSWSEVFGASARQSLADLTADTSRQSWSEVFGASARRSWTELFSESARRSLAHSAAFSPSITAAMRETQAVRDHRVAILREAVEAAQAIESLPLNEPWNVRWLMSLPRAALLNLFSTYLWLFLELWLLAEDLGGDVPDPVVRALRLIAATAAVIGATLSVRDGENA